MTKRQEISKDFTRLHKRIETLKVRAKKAEDTLKFEKQMRKVGEKELLKLAHEDVDSWVEKLVKAETRLDAIERALRSLHERSEDWWHKLELETILDNNFPKKVKTR